MALARSVIHMFSDITNAKRTRVYMKMTDNLSDQGIDVYLENLLFLHALLHRYARDRCCQQSEDADNITAAIEERTREYEESAFMRALIDMNFNWFIVTKGLTNMVLTNGCTEQMEIVKIEAKCRRLIIASLGECTDISHWMTNIRNSLIRGSYNIDRDNNITFKDRRIHEIYNYFNGKIIMSASVLYRLVTAYRYEIIHSFRTGDWPRPSFHVGDDIKFTNYNTIEAQPKMNQRKAGEDSDFEDLEDFKIEHLSKKYIVERG